MASLLVKLVLLSTVVSSVSSDDFFSCANLTSHPCSCSIHTPTIFELLCPGTDPQLTVQINVLESVQLQCIKDYSGFSSISGLLIGDVDRFVLRLCPLPDTSIRDLMASIGISKIKMLQIQSYGSFNDTLKKKHFEKLYYVTSLSLNSNGLTALPSDVFEDMGNLTWLDMKHNNVDLPKEIFYFTPKLEVLELGKNNLTHLTPGIFKNLDRLRLLNLWENELKNLTRPVFSDVPNLESLDLSSNHMETIRPDLFADLIKLKRLNLYANAFISLPQGLLSRNTELEEFQMHENKRSVHLPPGLFANLTRLKIVRLSGSKLTSLPEDMFSRSKNINHLYLNRNLLTTLPDKIFIDLENLEDIDLSENLIASLPEGVFMRNNKLKTLKLNYNQIAEIPSRLFLQLKNLIFLDLRFNKLREIRGGQFKNLQNLKSLNISDNQLTTLAQTVQLNENEIYSVLDKCNQLEDLQLANNSLREIYEDWRILHSKLHTLNLAFNSIQYVSIMDLNFLNDITIDLSNNNISHVSFRGADLLLIEHLENVNTSFQRDNIKIITVKFDNNPFICDCQLLPLVQFLQNSLHPEELQYLFKISDANLKCHEPMTLKDNRLSSIHPELLLCELKGPEISYKCPENCSCHFRSLNRGTIFNCANLGLQNVPSSLPPFFQANHSELNLEGNQLKNFKLLEGRGYDNLTHFYLSHNNIVELNLSGVSSKLEVLDLSYNNLTRLSLETVEMLGELSELVTLALYNNPWQCDCEAKPLIRLIKNRYKQVNHLPNVTCSNGISIANVEESELCPERFGVVVIGSMVCAILGVTVALSMILYYRYRTEIHVYCYSSDWKALQWFVSNPDYDDSKKYDAFISYANEDEKFVTEKLVPFLEEGERKFKLCLHYRDWIPGDSISDQILKSVQSSRRTIVVLSPNFLKSVWGTVEFKTAHTETMKDGTSKVIVIVYEDVGPCQNLDEDLKCYLQTNTYLKWESQWFWKQLVYALPHPKENAEDLKCIFGCFPAISRDSSNHEVLRNVQLKNGEVQYVTESSKKVSGKEDGFSPPSNTTMILESMLEEAKPKQSSPEKHKNGAAVIAV